MKILGLLDLKALTISDKKEVNIENFRIFSYKLSELGAEGVVIKGGNEKYEIKMLLTNELDIPVIDIEDLKAEIINVDEFLNKKKGKMLLIDDEVLLSLFNKNRDYLPNLISLISYKAKIEDIDTIITTDIESARIGITFP